MTFKDILHKRKNSSLKCLKFISHQRNAVWKDNLPHTYHTDYKCFTSKV